MSPAILKLAPQIVVLTAAGYWSWPALEGFMPWGNKPAAVSEKPEKAATFSAAMLSPKFPPVPERNPFMPPGMEFSTASKSGRPGDKKAGAEKIHAALDAKEAGLVLGATCIVGDRRMASINGRIYEEKQAIESPSDAETSFVLMDIQPHEVLLASDGQTLQLKYNDGPKPAGGKTAEDKPIDIPRFPKK